jgi:hypothetical protein
MDEFTLTTGSDSLQISLDEVYGFPDRTSHFGGYDARGTVTLHCGAYHVRGLLWFSTGEVWQFYTELRKAYDDLKGEALFRSSEGNLNFTVSFTRFGHWTLEGDYQEHLHLNSRLRFEMTSDQTYLVETLAQLSEFVAKYGDNRGYHDGPEA